MDRSGKRLGTHFMNYCFKNKKPQFVLKLTPSPKDSGGAVSHSVQIYCLLYQVSIGKKKLQIYKGILAISALIAIDAVIPAPSELAGPINTAPEARILLNFN
jgi:hypothetical protein